MKPNTVGAVFGLIIGALLAHIGGFDMPTERGMYAIAYIAWLCYTASCGVLGVQCAKGTF